MTSKINYKYMLLSWKESKAIILYCLTICLYILYMAQKVVAKNYKMVTETTGTPVESELITLSKAFQNFICVRVLLYRGALLSLI